MAEKHKHYFVNWIDGMKINKDHFITLENATVHHQNLIVNALINPFNFGLLPGKDDESSLDMFVELDSHKHVNIKVNRCKAVTAGGMIIDLDTSVPELSEFDLSLKDYDLLTSESDSDQFYIVLKINPFNRTPTGNADPDENPPRHPYAIAELDVHVVPVDQMNKSGFGDNFQVIGKLIVRENIPSLDKDYIPPCSRVSSDERLVAINNRLVEFFGKLELDIMQVIRKIHAKDQKSPLANSVMHLADKMAAFHGLHITRQRLFLKHLPPVTIFEAISQFAHLLINTLNTQPPDRREEMINYFSDWCNLKQGELELLLNETVNYDYNHYEIAALMSKMTSFIDTMSVLFETLSQLEYIGKRRDTQIYIKEEEKSKPKKSFLADD